MWCVTTRVGFPRGMVKKWIVESRSLLSFVDKEERRLGIPSSEGKEKKN